MREQNLPIAFLAGLLLTSASGIAQTLEQNRADANHPTGSTVQTSTTSTLREAASISPCVPVRDDLDSLPKMMPSPFDPRREPGAPTQPPSTLPGTTAPGSTTPCAVAENGTQAAPDSEKITQSDQTKSNSLNSDSPNTSLPILSNRPEMRFANVEGSPGIQACDPRSAPQASTHTLRAASGQAKTPDSPQGPR
jgi:hypothetical protein